MGCSKESAAPSFLCQMLVSPKCSNAGTTRPKTTCLWDMQTARPRFDPLAEAWRARGSLGPVKSRPGLFFKIKETSGGLVEEWETGQERKKGDQGGVKPEETAG